MLYSILCWHHLHFMENSLSQHDAWHKLSQSHVPSSTLNVAFPLFLLFRMLHDETSFSTFELILEICLGKAVERFFAFGYPSTRRKLCKFRLACWCRLMHFLDGNHITFAFLSLTCLGFFVDKLFPICIKIYNFTVLIMLLCLHAKSRFSLFFFRFRFACCFVFAAIYRKSCEWNSFCYRSNSRSWSDNARISLCERTSHVASSTRASRCLWRTIRRACRCRTSTTFPVPWRMEARTTRTSITITTTMCIRIIIRRRRTIP